MTGKIVVMLLFSFLMIAAGLFTVHPEGGGQWVHIALIGVGSLFNMMATALVVVELELLGRNGLGLAALEKMSRLEDKINRMEGELESLRGYVDADNWLKD